MNYSKITMLLFVTFWALASCSKDKETTPVVDDEPIPVEIDFYRGADMSFLPEIETENIVFKSGGVPQDALLTLKNAGCNVIRLRLWHSPENVHSSLQEVKQLAERVRSHQMQVWLTVHYSDTWADPGAQITPLAWQNMNFQELKTAMNQYTQQILTEINPDIFQIGNEINSGFVHPQGHLFQNENQSLELISSISQTIRQQKPNTKIMLHYAGLQNADFFFNKMQNIDYDYIGLSYYPIWHGKNMNLIDNTITQLGNTHQKKVILAEVSYPFTFAWNDFTNNIIGSSDQIIPEFPATPTGQRNYLNNIKNRVKSNPHGKGFCYWGTEWVAFRGNQATNGSSWENQALWDFGFNSLPAMNVFNP